MHESPPGGVAGRPGRREDSVRVAGDRFLVREIVRTVLGEDGFPAPEGTKGPGTPRPAGAAALEPYTNPVLLARVRALADEP